MERRGEERREPARVAVGSEEAVMGGSIGVEWIHLPFYEAIRSGRGGQVEKLGWPTVGNILAQIRQCKHLFIIETSLISSRKLYL